MYVGIKFPCLIKVFTILNETNSVNIILFLKTILRIGKEYLPFRNKFLVKNYEKKMFILNI